MRSIVICDQDLKEIMSENDSITTITMDGVPLTCGRIITKPPKFEPDDPQNQSQVLVRVRAFSCNYRDKLFFFKARSKVAHSRAYYAIGSEFVGEVVALGSQVSQLQVGDRVMGNNDYEGPARVGNNGLIQGTPSHKASREYQVFHEKKLVKVPPEMPDVVAAAFSVGAQTAYGMIHRLQIKEGSNVLVTSAKSNTSLFVIAALKKLNVNVVVTSTTNCYEDELKAMGVKKLVVVEPSLPNFAMNLDFFDYVRREGQFQYVIDPFFDLHLGRVMSLMAAGGKYITCGYCGQYQDLIDQELPVYGLEMLDLMKLAFINNLEVIGHCLGSTADLETAVADYQAGIFEPVIDSVFHDGQVGAFLDRTYNAKDRFGKTVYQYEANGS